MTTRFAFVALALFTLTPESATSCETTPTVIAVARIRRELPVAAFAACEEKVVGASCSFEAVNGICAASSTPGQSFCFHAPDPAVRAPSGATAPAVTVFARTRPELPMSAFSACEEKVVGASCSFEAVNGICAASSRPGQSFCFHAPRSIVGVVLASRVN